MEKKKTAIFKSPEEKRLEELNKTIQLISSRIEKKRYEYAERKTSEEYLANLHPTKTEKTAIVVAEALRKALNTADPKKLKWDIG